MALIICSECGKEYSDRATACPNCACPNPCVEHATKSFASESSTKATINFRPIIIAVIIIALIAVVSGHVHKVNLYNRGLDALYVGDYSTARNCLENLNYNDSKLIMNDISFLEDLEEIIRVEISYDSDIEYIMNSASNNISKLRQYKSVEFYTDGLDSMVDHYIDGLERIIDALEYESAASIQYELLAGKYYCDCVIVSLHDDLGFMQSSSQYSKVYKDIISKDDAMLTALVKLGEKGHVATQDGEFLYSQVTLYLKNDTEYQFDQTYIFHFYNGNQLLDTVTVDVLGIEPYTEYTVCIDVPQAALSGYSVNYSYYVSDVEIPDLDIPIRKRPVL